jgi:hypothetical protein
MLRTFAGGAIAIFTMASCTAHTSTPAKPNPTPDVRLTPTPAPPPTNVTFTGCGNPTYAEGNSPVTTTDVLSYAHKFLLSDPSTSNQTIRCGVKSFADTDVGLYLHTKSKLSAQVFVVVAHLQPTSGSEQAQVMVFLLSSTHPITSYGLYEYPPSMVPGLFQGI